MPRRKISPNYKMLRNIMSKMRQLDTTRESQYFILYSFLYKYCSDILRDHFQSVCDDKSVTLAQAYADDGLKDELRMDALKMFGFHIKNHNAFPFDIILSFEEILKSI